MTTNLLGRRVDAVIQTDYGARKKRCTVVGVAKPVIGWILLLETDDGQLVEVSFTDVEMLK